MKFSFHMAKIKVQNTERLSKIAKIKFRFVKTCISVTLSEVEMLSLNDKTRFIC
jgi:hypothetical protein